MNRKKFSACLLAGLLAVTGTTAYAQVYNDAETVKKVQEKLNEAGFECGTADGIAGSKTTSALQAYQTANQLEPSGEIDDALLESMGLAENSAETETAETEASEAVETETAEAAETEAAEAVEEQVSEEGDGENWEDAIPGGPIEMVNLDGTLIYNDHSVAVAAALSEDGQGVELRVQNDSDYNVFVSIANLAVNDVTLNLDEGYEFLWDLDFAMQFAESREEFDEYFNGIYVQAGTTDTRNIPLSFSDLMDIQDYFGYADIQKLQVSAGVSAVSKDIPFDGTYQLQDENYQYPDLVFALPGEFVEVEIPDSKWEDTWNHPEGSIFYDNGEICLIDVENYRVHAGEADENGSVYIDLVLENRSDQIVQVIENYDSITLFNGEEADYGYINLEALPGTRAIGFIMVESAELKEETDFQEIFLPTQIRKLEENGQYTRVDYADYVYTQEGDAEAVAEAAAEKKDQADLERTGYSIEEQTIYEADGFVIKATGVTRDEFTMRHLVNLEITNSTETDAKIYLGDLQDGWFGSDYIYVNGYQAVGGCVIDVPAGQTVEDTFYFDNGFLENIGIENVGEIELQFYITADSYEPIAELKPSVIHTSEYDSMDTEMDEKMQEIYSENGFTVYAKYVEGEIGLADQIIYAIRNDSAEGQGLHLDEVKINGMLDEDNYAYYGWDYVLPGKTYVSNCVTASFVEANEISQIESLSLNISVGATSEYGTPIFSTGEIAVPCSVQ